MTDRDKTLRVVAQMYILRDDLEDLDFNGALKQRTNMWLKEANKALEQMSNKGGKDANEEAIKLAQKLDKILIIN